MTKITNFFGVAIGLHFSHFLVLTLGAAACLYGPLAKAAALRPGYACVVQDEHADVLIDIYHDDQKIFEFRIGPGGSIAALKNVQSKENLLSPNYSENTTDRVIQWVTWSVSDFLRRPGSDHPDPRFNINQAGNREDRAAPVVDVDVDSANCTVDVWSVPENQWKPHNDHIMPGQYSALTHYEVGGEGELQIDRSILIGSIEAHNALLNDQEYSGNVESIPDFYLESWTPFNKPVFDSLGFGFNSKREVTRESTFKAGDVPSYPQIEPQDTAGYAFVFQSRKKDHGSAVGLVYGSDDPICNGLSGACEARSVVNSMEWDDGIGILPGVHVSVSTGTLLLQTLVVLPSRGLTPEFSARLDELNQEISPVEIYQPGADMPDGIKNLYADLSENFALGSQKHVSRPHHLGKLARRLDD